MVAKVLGHRLNFKKPRKITGQRSKGADQAVAGAVKAANSFLLGNSTSSYQTPNYNFTMPPMKPAEGTGDGGHQADEVHGNKARAPSKRKKDAAGPASSKKRAAAAPAGANTSKAAKKNKTDTSARQVRRERITAGAKQGSCGN